MVFFLIYLEQERSQTKPQYFSLNIFQKYFRLNELFFDGNKGDVLIFLSYI